MRMMLRITIPVARGNAAISDGSLSAALRRLIDELKPESAYFWAERGQRTTQMVFDMADTAQIPVIAEPLFMGLDAAVEFQPVMNAEDLKTGLAALAA